jgi:replication factor A1
MGITKAKDVQANQNFEQLDLEITSKGEVRSFANQKASGKVCNLAAKDDTGEIKVTLWNEQCDQFEEGDNIVIKDGWVSEYNGEKQVSTGRNGSIEKK